MISFRPSPYHVKTDYTCIMLQEKEKEKKEHNKTTVIYILHKEIISNNRLVLMQRWKLKKKVTSSL